MAELHCPGCRERDVRIAALEKQVAELQALVRDLHGRLGVNSSNSSVPPSANPPAAPKPVVKTPTGKKPGGQPGHPGHHRLRLPPERVQHVVPFVPTTCQHCHGPLPAQGSPNDPEPLWHQVAELPPMVAVVTEYQAHARTCTACGQVTRADWPDEIPAGTIGPRLAATVAYLSGSPHVSKRGIAEIVETIYDVPLGLGTVSALEQEMSQALAPAHTEAQATVQAAPVKHVDETGWKQAGQRCWLWVAATATVACFVIHLSRGAKGLASLLGEKVHGIVCSDRWSAYGQLLRECRQVCWAHLKRDFQKLIDRGGEAKDLGEHGQAVVGLLFAWWHDYRGGGIDRVTLQRELEPVRQEFRRQLQEWSTCADAKAATFCRNLLALEPALWTFVSVEGLEPTNNHAERVLRSGVLWRKNAFGCHSAAGCRFVERILTVVQTLRLQKRPVLTYLQQALEAHRHGLPAPKLLGTN